jgi:hypothetical protein
MPEASEDLTVAALFAERDARRRRDQEAAERLHRRKEEELATFKERLEDFHLADEMIPAQLERIKHAFERGESELMVASFPCEFCTDGGRAVILGMAEDGRREYFVSAERASDGLLRKRGSEDAGGQLGGPYFLMKLVRSCLVKLFCG